MAARLTCKNIEPDLPQRWLGSLRSPNQRLVQSPCGREVARAVDPFCCNRQLQQKLQLAPWRVHSAEAPFTRPPGADRDAERHRGGFPPSAHEFAAGVISLLHSKKGLRGPMFLTNDMNRSRPLKQKSLDAGRHTKPLTCLLDFLLEPLPLESNQLPDQVGQPVLIRLNRRKTAHFLPCQGQPETPGLGRSIYDYRRIRALRAFSERQSWT